MVALELSSITWKIDFHIRVGVMADAAFDWDQFLKVAEDLIKRDPESFKRTGVGRAYYYVFHLARKRILENGFFVVAGVDSHKQVWEKFSGSSELDCQKLGEIAKRLKEKRERADYKDAYPRIGEDAEQVLADARDFASRLGRLSPRLPANPGRSH